MQRSRSAQASARKPSARVSRPDAKQLGGAAAERTVIIREDRIKDSESGNLAIHAVLAALAIEHWLSIVSADSDLPSIGHDPQSTSSRGTLAQRRTSAC
jgi:hypothetical protein